MIVALAKGCNAQAKRIRRGEESRAAARAI